MKKALLLAVPALLIVLVSFERIDNSWSQNQDQTPASRIAKKTGSYQYPAFYKGIYLTSESGKSVARLQYFIQKAKAAHLNTVVIDVQNSRYVECAIPRENVEMCLKNGIHPIARIVMFPDGLKKYPVSEQDLLAKFRIAESACEKGFKEIQFDYIRFNDYRVLRHLSLQQRYDFIEGILARAREHLKKYDVKIAADIFGRIPLNKRDEIGQRMEGLDRVVDIICPMAYPSHYTWSRQLMADPYHTVFITSKKAKERTQSAEIVTYIQAFKMKLGLSKMSFEKYVEVQIKAVHDAGVRGYIMWNARQDYEVPLAVAKSYYETSAGRISRSKETEPASDKSI